MNILDPIQLGPDDWMCSVNGTPWRATRDPRATEARFAWNLFIWTGGAEPVDKNDGQHWDQRGAYRSRDAAFAYAAYYEEGPSRWGQRA